MINKDEISIYILASGKGTRMGDKTKSIPKPLLTLNEKPIICRVLDYFLKQNFLNINVNYAYLKDKWKPVIKEYKKISFVNTSGKDNIIQSFFSMLNQSNYKNNTIVLMSADVFFDYQIIDRAITHHLSLKNEVTVILNKKCGRWKKWRYIFSDNKITDIQIENEIQSIERYCLIISNDALKQYTNNFTENIGNNEKEFAKNILYGKGICFLIKNMLDYGIQINYQFYENELVNINDNDDYKKAELLASKLDAYVISNNKRVLVK